jgi:hypothetical protein
MDWGSVVSVIIGVLVGGTIQLVAALVIEGRRESATVTRDERTWAREDAFSAREVRRAQLLVADELDTIANHLRLMQKHSAWPKA